MRIYSCLFYETTVALAWSSSSGTHNEAEKPRLPHHAMWPEAAVFARINTAATATHKFGVGGFMNNAQWSEFSMDSSIFQDTVGRYT